MSTVPRVFHQTSKTSALRWEERVLLKRTQRLLNDWSYRLWTDDDLLSLFKERMPQLDVRFSSIKRGVVRSDIGRYMVLYSSGGLYIDTDYKFFREPVDLLKSECTIPVENGVVTGAHGAEQETELRLGNACLASASGFGFWKDFIESIFATYSNEALDSMDPILTTGPAALTTFWRQNAARYPEIALPPQRAYYPDLNLSRLGLARSSDTIGIHLAWGGWRSRDGTLHRWRNALRRKLTALY